MTMGSDGSARRHRVGPATGGVVAVAAAVTLLTGCQNLPIGGRPGAGQAEEQTAAAETPAQARGRVLAGLVDYYRGIQMAPRSVLEERAGHLAGQVQEGECDATRLKYAMVKKALGPPSEEPEARKLLGLCLESDAGADRALSGFAYLLEELWEAETVSVQYRKQLEQARHDLEGTRAEAAKLRKQLDGLKAIEQSIQQRDRDKGASGSQ